MRRNQRLNDIRSREQKAAANATKQPCTPDYPPPDSYTDDSPVLSPSTPSVKSARDPLGLNVPTPKVEDRFSTKEELSERISKLSATAADSNGRDSLQDQRHMIAVMTQSLKPVDMSGNIKQASRAVNKEDRFQG